LDQLLTQLEAMAASETYPLTPLLPQTVIASHEHTVVPDIFDRLIVTEAVERGVAILTGGSR
jgi:hypothetical protein